MYLDLGKERGKVRFTWKELTALFVAVLSLMTHYVMTEVQFSQANKRALTCEDRLKTVEEKLEEIQNTIPPLFNVLILRRVTAAEYLVQTEGGQAFHITFCEDSHVDFHAGQKLQSLTYRQEAGCKSLNGPKLGFILYPGDNYHAE